MGKATGFLEYKRENGPVIPEEERVKDFKEFHERLSLEEQQKQGARCMDCGVPFCQAGCMLAGMMCIWHLPQEPHSISMRAAICGREKCGFSLNHRRKRSAVQNSWRKQAAWSMSIALLGSM